MTFRTGSNSEPDFTFAFNVSNFSDRVLCIEIMPDPIDAEPDSDASSTNADWVRHRKRRREDIKKENVMDLALWPEEPVMDEFLTCENQYEEAVAMAEESSSGDETSNSTESNGSMDCTAVMTVKTLHISSPILAAKSHFFYKLFSNEMRESEQRHVTLRINASEEDALMQLLYFMYSNTLSYTSASAVLDVLMAADKFEVASCLRYCSHLLQNMPMTPDSALLYLELPSTVLMAKAIQPLVDAAKQFLADRYKDITKYEKEVMALSLLGVEAILASDDLRVASEDVVYDFVLKWARTQYSEPEERREVLGARLSRLIRFPYMSCRKLKKALVCNDFDHEVSSKLVLEALMFKAELPHRQCSMAAEKSAPMYHRFVERSYKYRPVKVVEFDLPRPQCIVYLDLKREECINLFPSHRIYTQAFHLGGQGFFLSAHCSMDQQISAHSFGLFLGMQEKGVSLTVDYEFSARSRPTDEFVKKYKGNYTFTGGKPIGYRNLLDIPWHSFMSEDCLYFINGVLHLRAVLTVRQ